MCPIKCTENDVLEAKQDDYFKTESDIVTV